jgi:hypothetical protein
MVSVLLCRKPRGPATGGAGKPRESCGRWLSVVRFSTEHVSSCFLHSSRKTELTPFVTYPMRHPCWQVQTSFDA